MADVLRVEESEAQEVFFDRGWTDGLPVIPPTPERVEAMLAEADLDADDHLGEIAQRGVTVCAQQAAICAVMAGCRPAYFPVVIAAVEALLDPAFNAHSVLTSTGGAATCVIVSGPFAEAIGMNAGHGALGPGNRANATIGRTLRLLAITALDARPGLMDASSLGHPGKLTLCFAEDPPPAPWESLREALGFEHGDTTVTLMATEGPRQIGNHLNGDGRGVLASYAAMLRSPATFMVGKGGQAIFVVGPEHMIALAEAGITRAQAASAIATESRISPAELERAGIVIEHGAQHDMTPGEDGLLPAVTGPEDVLLVTAGGGGAGWSALLPSFAPKIHSRFVSRRVRPPGEALPDCGEDGCEINLPPIGED
jgi:hypothetical protein